MTKRDEVIKFIRDTLGEELLAKAIKLDPENANGVQFLGQENVSKIALGVTADSIFFQKAKDFGAQFLICHHGLRFGEVKTKIPITMQKRLKVLFDLDATLCAFHFAIDNHPVLGNSAQIIKLLGARKTGENFFEEWGWVGEFDQEKDLREILKKCKEVFKVEPKGFFAGKKKIKRMAVVSGSGVPYPYSDEVWDWKEKGIDLHLTGVAKEPTQSICEEAGINYVYMGHYNSEVFGVKALGKEIEKKFPKIKVRFIYIPNPL